MSGHKRQKERRGGKFSRIPANLIETDAWRSMSANAAKVHIVLCHRYNGFNNSEISLPERKGGEMTGLDRRTVRRALAELESLGFIEKMKDHRLGLGGKGRAAKWRLTHEPANSRGPTREFASIRIPPNGTQKEKSRDIPCPKRWNVGCPKREKDGVVSLGASVVPCGANFQEHSVPQSTESAMCYMHGYAEPATAYSFTCRPRRTFRFKPATGDFIHPPRTFSTGSKLIRLSRTQRVF